MTSSQSKPTKPHPSFPLTPHPNGQWCKKIRGKLRFFGVWADPQAAMERYLKHASDLHAGREPTVSVDELTVKELANHYLNYQAQKLDAGEIGPRWFEDCRRTLKEFAQATGKQRVVSDLRPVDFQTYRSQLSRRLGVHAITRTITVVKGMFKYAVETDLIPEAPRLQHALRKPTATQVRKSKQQAELIHGKKLFQAEDLRRILDASPVSLRPAVLLGINGGFGNTDCGKFPVAAIDFSRAVIEYSRPKTGVQRVVPLWDETLAAIQAMRDGGQSKGATPEANALLFCTETGRALVRQRYHHDEQMHVTKVTYIDRLGDQFDKVLTTLSLKRRGIGFYTLRHTFRTWADGANDQHAIHRIMGHAIPGMSGIYVEEIELHRLRAVVDHVHRKLFGARSSSTISLSRITAEANQRSASTTE